MRRRSVLVAAVAVLGSLVLLAAPGLEATPAGQDAPGPASGPGDGVPRMVAFELFNRSQSGG